MQDQQLKNDILYDQYKDGQAELAHQDEKLREQAGLVRQGEDDEGNPLYIGTTKQWEKYEELKDILNS